MRDIYSVLVTHDFSKVSDEALAESRSIYGDSCMAINHAMQVIGNLLLEVEGDEEYSGDDARRDLSLIGTVLRHLPRMSEALAQNGNSVEFELRMRRGGVNNDQPLQRTVRSSSARTDDKNASSN